MAEAKLSMSLDDIIKKSSAKAPPTNPARAPKITGESATAKAKDQKGGKPRQRNATGNNTAAPRAPLVIQKAKQSGSQGPQPMVIGGAKGNRRQKQQATGGQQQTTFQQGSKQGTVANVRSKNKGRNNNANDQQRAPTRAPQGVNLGVKAKTIDKRGGQQMQQQRGRQQQTVQQGYGRSPMKQKQPMPAPLHVNPMMYAPMVPMQAPMQTPPLYTGHYQTAPAMPQDSHRWTHDRYMDQGGMQMAMPRTVDPQLLPGTRLIIKNLDVNVTEDDVKELFSVVGLIQRHRLFYDKSGRSLGEAEVLYINKEHAVLALEKYNTVSLDGKRMMIELVADTSKLAAAGAGMSRAPILPGGAPGGRPNMMRNLSAGAPHARSNVPIYSGGGMAMQE